VRFPGATLPGVDHLRHTKFVGWWTDLKVAENRNQAYVDSMSAALREGDFRPHLARRDLLGLSMAAGYKIVYIADKKTYRAELNQIDVVLAAKPEDSKP
jgi:hypothetical protein